MNAPGQNQEQSDPWSSLEPYAQLIRCLLPRAASVAVFDAEGNPRWSSEPDMGPDLVALVDDTLYTARSDTKFEGRVVTLGGDTPVYVCALRDESQELLALLAIPCRRAAGAVGQETGAFALTHALLRPAVECLRRELISRAAICSLNRAVSDLDRDLELLVADAAQLGAVESGADELASLVQSAVEHLKCEMGVLIVPEKGIAVLRARRGERPDAQLLARTHRHLVSMCRLRADPVIVNRIAPSESLGVIPYRILCCPIRQSGGKTLGAFALFRSQSASELTQRDARLAEVVARRAAGIIDAQYDALTGLFTRPVLEQRIRALSAARTGESLWSVVYLDADRLHLVNENFGMRVGDSVIGRLGELVRGRLPPGGLGARIAGDRFALLVPSEVGDAANFAEGLRAGAELLGVGHADPSMRVTVSVGVSPLDLGAGDLAHALAAAETACKAAKDRGRNRIAVYQPDDTSLVRRFSDITLAARLRDAIDSDRLRLDAQLILPLEVSGSRPARLELLLRMIGDDGATIGPEKFLSAANRYQLMPLIDRWVIDNALGLLKLHGALLAEHPAVFSINFSGQSLSDEHFGDFLVGAIEASGLDPGVLCFELTESATVLNVARAEALMRRLRRLGCGIALDDFGTGLSSLAYLRQLPVTLLKIDGSFVRDIVTDTRAEFMVRAIAQLARGMELGTIAEFVETDEIRERVATLGVDYGQGFAIGRPRPLAEALAQLRALAIPGAPFGTGAQAELDARRELSITLQ
ncbi:MAG TPA: bifunctional diguanylate cyclase/phosphodiesterase [Steroidobacteraceae bacterium]|nr:bifunctional diguanylate cyclase/phosphodiesterase [Steroidobacteraceae bacterium]